jgi:hypothetical protein
MPCISGQKVVVQFLIELGVDPAMPVCLALLITIPPNTQLISMSSINYASLPVADAFYFSQLSSLTFFSSNADRSSCVFWVLYDADVSAPVQQRLAHQLPQGARFGSNTTRRSV